jgi:hypothetical protein
VALHLLNGIHGVYVHFIVHVEPDLTVQHDLNDVLVFVWLLRCVCTESICIYVCVCVCAVCVCVCLILCVCLHVYRFHLDPLVLQGYRTKCHSIKCHSTSVTVISATRIQYQVS